MSGAVERDFEGFAGFRAIAGPGLAKGTFMRRTQDFERDLGSVALCVVFDTDLGPVVKLPALAWQVVEP